MSEVLDHFSAPSHTSAVARRWSNRALYDGNVDPRSARRVLGSFPPRGRSRYRKHVSGTSRAVAPSRRIARMAEV